MRHGSGIFNKSASSLYSTLGEEEKHELKVSAAAKTQEKMTVKDIKKAGTKIFGKIQKQVQFLQCLSIVLWCVCVCVCVYVPSV